MQMTLTQDTKFIIVSIDRLHLLMMDISRQLKELKDDVVALKAERGGALTSQDFSPP